MLEFANAEDDRNKVVSALADIEARSAIFRLQQGKAITVEEAKTAVGALADEIKRVMEQPIHATVLDGARRLVERHLLRALDAIQLASALAAKGSLGASEMQFIAADRDLLAAALKEGLTIWNPCD